MCIPSCITPRATFQSKIYKPQKKGVISYSLMPVLFQSDAVQTRRMDAKMKMEEFCAPKKPVIVSEKREEKTAGYYTSTSYQDYSNQYSGSYGTAGKNQYSSTGGGTSSTSGSASTMSQPIVNTYNIISFECK